MREEIEIEKMMRVNYKMTNFERGVKIPLIIRAPWMAASIGQTSRALVEMVDVCECAPSIAAAAIVMPRLIMLLISCRLW